MRYYGVQNEVKAYCNRLQSETSITVTPSLVKTLNDRVESLKKSGVWSQFSLGFNDNDGDEYLQRASVTDILGRSEVLWFVRGMKSLGLWQNMVCWPLRSYQNIGTSNTVYSLGGLGVFDGTAINSPTWGADGIIFVKANSQRVDLNVPSRSLGHQEVVFKASAPAGGAEGPFDRGNGHHYARVSGAFYAVGIFNGGGFQILSPISFTSLAWHNIALTYGTGGMIGFSQGAQLGTNANALIGSFTPPNIKLGNGQFSWSGTIPFFADFSVRFDAALHLRFYNLYKSTLGSGLGLP